MVGQKQPQGHVKCEDQGCPQTRSEQRRRQDSPKSVLLSTPGRVRETGLGLLASEAPSLRPHPAPALADTL